MNILLIGVGGVGESIAICAQGRPWLGRMVLADINWARAQEVYQKLRDPERFSVEYVDAGDPASITGLARKYKVELILNAVEPQFNEAIFDTTFAFGCTYMDMAMTLAEHHPTDRYNQAYVKLGDYQFDRHAQWEERGQLALLGMGIDPGVANIFARYAQVHLFDRVDEINVRDGSNITVEGFAFAPTFSIWTTIDECLNPPVVWERERGWYTTQPFSEPEVFTFPEGIGPLECVNVEHEEVMMLPRFIDCQRVTFKYGLGDKFIRVLKTLHMLGMDNKHPVKVKDVEVAPRDVVAACLPDPARLGDRMSGKTCVGTWVKGIKDGKPLEVFLYQSTDNAECMGKYGCQAIVWQTGVSATIALELLATGVWQGRGVLGPEAFDPDPYLERMPAYDHLYRLMDMTPA